MPDSVFLSDSDYVRIQAVRALSIAACVVCMWGMICSMIATIKRAPSLPLGVMSIICSMFSFVCTLTTLIMYVHLVQRSFTGIPDLKLSWGFGLGVAGCVMSFMASIPYIMERPWSDNDKYETVGHVPNQFATSRMTFP
jgi:hypothetical protein